MKGSATGTPSSSTGRGEGEALLEAAGTAPVSPIHANIRIGFVLVNLYCNYQCIYTRDPPMVNILADTNVSNINLADSQCL